MLRFIARLTCLGALALTGCMRDKPFISPGRAPGHVVLLPGIEGGTWQFAYLIEGLRAGGVEWEIEVIPWGTPPLHSMANLTDLPANHERAKRIAARLAELRRDAPDAPLVLVGYSGGGGLAMLTANILPADVKLDRIVLIAAAISNTFMTNLAEDACNDKVVSFHSPRDEMVGLGTKLFGTIDRVKTVSAGHSGFVDQEGKLRSSPKLRQIAYDASWGRYQHLGGHVGYLTHSWAKNILAPEILAAARGPKCGGDAIIFEPNPARPSERRMSNVACLLTEAHAIECFLLGPVFSGKQASEEEFFGRSRRVMNLDELAAIICASTDNCEYYNLHPVAVLSPSKRVVPVPSDVWGQLLKLLATRGCLPAQR